MKIKSGVLNIITGGMAFGLWMNSFWAAVAMCSFLSVIDNSEWFEF